LQFVPPRRVQKFCPAYLPPEQRTCAAVGAPRAVMCMLRAILNISERRVHQQQATTSGFGRLAAPVRAASAAAPRAWLYTLCHRTFPAAEAALGLQPASSAVSLVGSFICQMQGGDRGHCTIGSRAAAADAIHRATLSAQWFRPGDLPPEQTSCAAVGVSRACSYGAPD